MTKSRRLLTNQAANRSRDQGRTKLLFLRPPYDDTDSSTRKNAAGLGHEIVMWDVDPTDCGAGRVRTK